MKTKLIKPPIKHCGIATTHKINNTELQNNIQYFLSDIKKILKEEHWLYARCETHITLVDYITEHTKFLFYRNAGELVELAYSATEGQPCFSVVFTEYRRMGDTIAVVSQDSGEMNRIRRKIIEKAIEWGVFRPERPLYPNIVHTTVARFTSPLSDEEKDKVDEIIKKYNSHYIGIEHITGFDVIKFTRPKDYLSGYSVHYIYLGRD